MGVYIKNMEMPKNCDDCFLPLQYCPYAMKPDGSCHLIAVHDHGEFIDLRELLKEQLTLSDGYHKVAAVRVRDICLLPTIIPAEEG